MGRGLALCALAGGECAIWWGPEIVRRAEYYSVAMSTDRRAMPSECGTVSWLFGIEKREPQDSVERGVIRGRSMPSKGKPIAVGRAPIGPGTRNRR
jgi:hypothetical protein